jgi:hypothetical protein
MPLVVKLPNLKYSIVNVMPDTLIIVRDVIMIGITVNCNLTRHRLFVVLKTDGLEQLIGNQAPFQFLHHGLAVGMSLQPRVIIVDVTHITLRLCLHCLWPVQGLYIRVLEKYPDLSINMVIDGMVGTLIQPFPDCQL